MAPSRVAKSKATKKAVAKPVTKSSKLAPETSREVLEERLEFVLTCIKETGIKIDYVAVGRHYGISNNAACLRFLRCKDHVSKLVRVREAAQKADEAQKGDNDSGTTEDEEV
ncbi:hypothetical protein LT330_002831 [Penicillium expansum]|uniref:Myb-like DNA-binding domain-containing protein n=1 Tax=Penicillium expansum TaxID=27334 RepID=A0A0A2ILG1_PENEN|nr:hypothetical protein PEX2_109730 [Penicillium expansum]KAK4862698.1 hypothetical protein LT330_002831 [Penicillium expansum]KGO43268.1 hypothetical protein PEXP_028980 [Penicillium expansum]KGO44968.1 hypothetical protein PEX1_000780 [Penicillium expansum]KGO52324.1 hypothetical protein PEX2_109730 [Penicillium expansum]